MNALSYVPLDTPIHNLNPLTKFFILACLWIVAFASVNLVILGVVIVFNLILWVIARIPLGGLKVFLGTIVVVGILMVITQGFLFAGAKTVLFSIFGLKYYLEGAIFGVTIATKVLAIATAIPLLTMTTPVSELISAFSALHIPYKPIFVFGTAMRLAPLVEESFNQIRDAQRLRGHDIENMNIFKKITKGYYPIFVPLLLSLLRETSAMDVAIESKAFGRPGKRTYIEEMHFHAADLLALVIVGGFTAAILWFATTRGLGTGLQGWGGPFGS
jgi:energy-coupling factor transport system permease protein